MRPPPPLGPSFFARWTSRIAVFSAALLATAAFLHRLFSLPTPVAANLAGVAFIGAGLSILMSMAAIIGIWRTGRPGTPRIVFAILVSLALMLWPLIFLPKYNSLPSIYDVTTDTDNPPPFVAIAEQRGPGANPVVYAGEPFARKQRSAYPDIRPIEINRPADEVFELAVAAIKRLKMPIVNQQPPDDSVGRPGLIEIADRSLILGLYEDIAIRVSGTEQHARVDVRSASRYGSHDLGRNAERARQLLKEIVVSMESTVPAARGEDAEDAKAAKEERPHNRRSKNRRKQ
ncbi:MAG TPA: DUF1499 domain-containing protein [Hyphomicrobium sp.]|nr:DUF1499 domain-containing protein [Hyphomicrobium sp.]